MFIIGSKPYIFNVHVKLYAKVPKFPGLKSKLTVNKVMWEFSLPVLDVQVQEFSNFFVGFPFITSDGYFIFNEPVKAKLIELVKTNYEAVSALENMKPDGRYAAEIVFHRSRVDGQPDQGEDFAQWAESTPLAFNDPKKIIT